MLEQEKNLIGKTQSGAESTVETRYYEVFLCKLDINAAALIK